MLFAEFTRLSLTRVGISVVSCLLVSVNKPRPKEIEIAYRPTIPVYPDAIAEYTTYAPSAQQDDDWEQKYSDAGTMFMARFCQVLI